MNKEKGSSTIGMIALIAIALLVGIWIGAEKDAIMTELNSGPAVFQETLEKTMDDAEMMEEEVVVEEETEVVE